MSDRQINKYDIWLANLNPALGKEPGKVRPVVILQSDTLNHAGHLSIVTCAISSQQRSGFSIIRLQVNPDEQNGLKKESYILVDQIRSLDRVRLLERVGKLDRKTCEKLISSLKAILAIS